MRDRINKGVDILECITTSIDFSLLRGSNHNGQSCNLICNPENTLECIMAVFWEEATTDYTLECITTSALQVQYSLVGGSNHNGPVVRTYTTYAL